MVVVNESREQESKLARIADRKVILSKQSSNAGWIATIIVILVIVATGFYFWQKRDHSNGNEVAPEAASSVSASRSPADTIAHPIAQAAVAELSASAAPLPSLNSSDAHVISTLDALIGNSDLSALLLQPQVVQRIVATVDSLPRRGLNSVMMPMRTPKSSFTTQDAAGGLIISVQNDARYAPYMQVVQITDPKKLVAWYVQAYPLFQQAYRQLGYPTGYFNDRLIVAIDNLLAAPELEQRPSVALSSGYFRYVDPRLESLSAGQRAMLRVGPQNEAILKSRLREVRLLLLGQHLQRGAAPSPTGRNE